MEKLPRRILTQILGVKECSAVGAKGYIHLFHTKNTILIFHVLTLKEHLFFFENLKFCKRNILLIWARGSFFFCIKYT